jgi:hypothetical protein
MSPNSALTYCTYGPASGKGGLGAVQMAECAESEVHDPIALIRAPGSVTVTLKASVAYWAVRSFVSPEAAT